MANITSNLSLYSFTLQPPAAVSQAVLGNFAGGGAQNQYILVASGSYLNLFIPDSSTGEIKTVCSHNVFGIIRSIAAFRLVGTSKDHIIVGTDSGRVTTLEWLPEQKQFSRIHLETFGKSGVRRAIPGQYLAVDPKGRASLLASAEKNKIVYVLNRDAQAHLTISSPLEAHKPHNLVYGLIALDRGFQNPVFATIEVDYGDSEEDSPELELTQYELEKTLVYYVLDLGLNHVIRAPAGTVDRTANLLLQVPGDNDGPSGVLVCGVEHVAYHHHHIGQKDFQQPAIHRVSLPQRKGPYEELQRPRRVVAGVMHKMKGAFFFLVQSEDGDLFKVTMDVDDDKASDTFGEVQGLKISYFATVPVASTLLVLKSGLLFVACDSGEHILYRFLGLGEDADVSESIAYEPYNYPARAVDNVSGPATFIPQETANLTRLYSVSTASPTMASQVASTSGDNDIQKVFSACGTGARSSFRALQHGLHVEHYAASPLPAIPNAVWTTKLNHADEHDSYLVLGFNDTTLILSIGESIEEVSESESRFMPRVPTLAVQLLASSSLVQIHHRGIRLIRRHGSTDDWEAPQNTTIVAAATNERQIALGLSNGSILYFELEDDTLDEYEEQLQLSGTITCMALMDIPEGSRRCPFLAVGCGDETVRVVSLNREQVLQPLSVQGLSKPPTALHIMAMDDSTTGASTLYLHIGLQSGLYLRVILDEVTGRLSDSISRVLGPGPVKFSRTSVQQQTALLAISTRPWLVYSDLETNLLRLTPLDYPSLECGYSFSSETLPEGLVGVARNRELRLFSVPSLSSHTINQSVPLSYTPRGFVKHPAESCFFVIESDHNTLDTAKSGLLEARYNALHSDERYPELPAAEFGYPKVENEWASCIQIIDAEDNRVTSTIHLENNEAATAVGIARIASKSDAYYVFVGTGKDMTPMPRGARCGYIRTYKVHTGSSCMPKAQLENGENHAMTNGDIEDRCAEDHDSMHLQFVHATQVDEPPTAFVAFRGRLLAGIGKTLIVYDVGKVQLLRKCMRQNVTPVTITSLNTEGWRIVVGDARESLTYVVYDHPTNNLLPFADDSLARWSTCSAMVDYETTVGADKFGNIFLLRCPQKASEEADGDSAVPIFSADRGYLNGAPYKLDLLAHFFTADIPVSIHKTQLKRTEDPIILWSGLQGTVGLLAPFKYREEVEFFTDLERLMRDKDPPLCGRDHLMFRGVYVPVKGTVDGDLCEKYMRLDTNNKMRIASELDKSVREVEKKIIEMRVRFAY